MKKVFGFLFLSLVWFACSTDSGTARLEVRLTDAPGDYEEVNVDIQDVQVNSGDGTSGWVSLDVQKGVYNLLDLTNGLDTLLGSAELPVGKISQIRLVLGNNNTIKEKGEIKTLSTPSAQQSGLKLNLNTTLEEGVTYTIKLDFDAARSIVKAGNSGRYNLKPVIRAMEEATSGAIKGTVTPLEASPAIYAIQGTDTVATAFTDTTSGKFMLRALPAGSYTVSFSPKTGYLPLTKDNVTVTVGSVTDVGTVTINK